MESHNLQPQNNALAHAEPLLAIRPQDAYITPPLPSRDFCSPHQNAYSIPSFPLTIERLMNLCTHCWLPGQRWPFSQQTGEGPFFGFYYPTQLHMECELLLPRPILIMDLWEIRCAIETFENNPDIFRCESIHIVLGYCEAHMRNNFPSG